MVRSAGERSDTPNYKWNVFVSSIPVKDETVLAQLYGLYRE